MPLKTLSPAAQDGAHFNSSWCTDCAKIRAMERSYDLFEKMEDGSLIWRGAVCGLDAGIAELKKLASETPNELHLMYLATQSVVAKMNGTKAD